MVTVTLGARDFSSAVSCSCQVFKVTRLRPKMCRPSANTENSYRTREKPLVPMVGNCTRLLKIKNKLKIGCFYKYSREEFSIFCGRFQ